MKLSAFSTLVLLLSVIPSQLVARNNGRYTDAATVASVTFAHQTGGDGTAGAPAEVDLADFSATITVDGGESEFEQGVSGYIFYDASTTVADLDGGLMTIAPGATAAVTVSGDLSSLASDHIYLFVPWSAEAGQLGDPVYFRSAAGAAAERSGADLLRVYNHQQNGTVTLVSPDPIAGISLYSLNGEYAHGLVTDGDYTITVDLSELSSGLYVLETTYADGSIVSDNIIKR